MLVTSGYWLLAVGLLTTVAQEGNAGSEGGLLAIGSWQLANGLWLNFVFRISTFVFRISTFDFRISYFDFRISTLLFALTGYWLLNPQPQPQPQSQLATGCRYPDQTSY